MSTFVAGPCASLQPIVDESRPKYRQSLSKQHVTFLWMDYIEFGIDRKFAAPSFNWCITRIGGTIAKSHANLYWTFAYSETHARTILIVRESMARLRARTPIDSHTIKIALACVTACVYGECKFSYDFSSIMISQRFFFYNYGLYIGNSTYRI